MKLGKLVSAVLGLGVVLVSLSACESNEGPAERAGKQVDAATNKVGEQVEKAGEAIQDAAKEK